MHLALFYAENRVNRITHCRIPFSGCVSYDDVEFIESQGAMHSWGGFASVITFTGHSIWPYCRYLMLPWLSLGCYELSQISSNKHWLLIIHLPLCFTFLVFACQNHFAPSVLMVFRWTNIAPLVGSCKEKKITSIESRFRPAKDSTISWR